MKKVRVFMVLAVIAVLLSLLGCGTQTKNNAASQPPKNTSDTSQNNTFNPSQKNDPIVTITMADGGQIKIELYPKVAPNTVKNFIYLVRKGFYNGLTFHRVIPGFMIQGGDPNGNGTGGPGYSIKGEFTNNGFTNNLKHVRGVVSMARTNDPNSAGSQFFIMVAAAPSLDGNYAAFGKVISGMSEVDKIVNTPRNTATNQPLQKQVMKSVTVDTFGINYGDPVIIKQ
jgi:peptidyl-prolyl cis-trans isomerase B (cyclophilin B)